MKKIIAIAISAVLMASSTFALGLSAGAKANLGKTMSNDWAQVGGEFKEVTMNSEFDFGFGGFVNVEVLGGLGVQAEVNVIKNKLQFTGKEPKDITAENSVNTSNYEVWLVDVPVMLWDNMELGPVTLGFGGGVNLSYNLDKVDQASIDSALNKSQAVFQNKQYEMGVAAGIDAKVKLSDTLGVVASARYIGNFDKSTATVPVEVSGGSQNIEYPTVDFKRNSFYAGIGLELKIF